MKKEGKGLHSPDFILVTTHSPGFGAQVFERNLQQNCLERKNEQKINKNRTEENCGVSATSLVLEKSGSLTHELCRKIYSRGKVFVRFLVLCFYMEAL